LWLDQNQINKEHDKVMLDVLVGEAFASRTLRESDPLSESTVIGFAVRGVECVDRAIAFAASS